MLLDDMLQATTGDLGHAVGIVAQDEGGVHLPVAIVKHLGTAGLDEAHAVQLADLTVVDVDGVLVLMGLAPLVVGHQVELDMGMDDAHIVAVDLGSVLSLQETDSLADVVDGQHIAGIQIAAGRNTASILHHSTGIEHLTGDGIQGAASLRGDSLGGLHQHGIDGGQVQHIGDGHITTILLDGSLDGAHGQALAVGSHTLGDGGEHLGQSVPLAELDGLTAMLGDGVLLAELVMDQLRLHQVDQIVAVEGLHLARHAVGGGDLGVHVSKQLKVEQKVDVVDVLHVDFLLS